MSLQLAHRQLQIDMDMARQAYLSQAEMLEAMQSTIKRLQEEIRNKQEELDTALARLAKLEDEDASTN